MIVREAEFAASAARISDWPPPVGPEVAFVGRSNVGKSSLINKLLNRRHLARTSSQPGKTQTINFYRINGEFFLVDLPGYGYAKVAKSILAGWGAMIEGYLTGREGLRAVGQIVDIRHAPTRQDLQMREWLDYNGIETITIATKVDKISRNTLASRLKDVRAGLSLDRNRVVLPVSADSGAGIEELWTALEGFLDV